MISQKTYQNFKSAFEKMKEFLSEPVLTERDRAGIIQAFEFTFEQFWKCIQKKAHQEGLSANSPKQALKVAFQLHWIEPTEETLWIQMLEDRNLSSHTYHETNAMILFERIEKNYLPLFQKFLEKLILMDSP